MSTESRGRSARFLIFIPSQTLALGIVGLHVQSGSSSLNNLT